MHSDFEVIGKARTGRASAYRVGTKPRPMKALVDRLCRDTRRAKRFATGYQLAIAYPLLTTSVCRFNGQR